MSATKISSKSSIFSSGSSTNTSKRDESAASPARISRLQEKEELQNLNDRLAAYIDKVRHLEHENDRLLYQIHSSEETVKKEITSIKNIYEHELTEARKLLDEVSKDKAKLQIEAGKYKSLADDLSIKLGRRERELREAEKVIANLEGELNDLKGKYNQLLNEKKKMEEENKQYRLDNMSYEKQLNIAKRQLEDETLMRVDLENRIQSLQEDLDFKKSIHDKEISEIRTRRELAIREIDDKLQQEYEHKLEDALRDMRFLNDSQIQRAREEVEEMYQAKLADLQSAADRNTDTNSMLREDVYRYRSQVEDVQGKIRGLEAQLSSAESRVQELEKSLLLEKSDHEHSIRSRDDEIRRLRETMSDYLLEYQELMDIKLALDMELVAYRKMLEGEEARLNLTPRHSVARSSTEKSGTAASGSTTGTASSATTPAPSTGHHKSASHQTTGSTYSRKRKRPVHESVEENSSSTSFKATQGSTGDIEIVDSDPDGAFVKFINKSNKDIPMGGWTVTRKAGEQSTTHKLYRQCVLKAGETITVWSSSAHANRDPPTDIVMKNQSWPLGDNYNTKIFNKEGEEVAWHEATKTVSTVKKSHARYTLTPAGKHRFTEVDSAFEPTANGEFTKDQEKCRIM